MELANYISSGYLILLFFLAAAGIYLFLYIIRMYIPVMFSGRIDNKLFRKYFTIAEGLSWSLFLLTSAFFFLKSNIFFSVLLFLSLLILLYWFSQFALRDCIAGLVFKADNRFSVGDILVVGEVKGEIKQFHYRNIEIENENGNLILLPYTMLLGMISSPQKISETVLSYSFEISVTRDYPYNKAADLLKKHILSLPWAIIKNEPKIQLLKESENTLLLKITIFSFDDVYFQPMRKRIEEYISDNLKPSLGKAP